MENGLWIGLGLWLGLWALGNGISSLGSYLEDAVKRYVDYLEQRESEAD